MRHAARLTLLAAGLALLAGCASTGPAPVDERSLNAPFRSAAPARGNARAVGLPGGNHRVERGDTLYSIAFRNGVDYRELASWNGIGSPYTIYVGQELRLAPKTAAASSRREAASASVAPGVAHAGTAPPATADSTSATPPRILPGGVPAPTPFENVNPNAVSSTTANAAQSGSTQVPATSPGMPPPLVGAAAKPAEPPLPPPAAVAPQTAQVIGDIAWRWPADGQIVGGYVGGDQTRQGLDIAGKAGDPVRAAADGSVVYSGNGLIGYGELIIVKHSPGFLSAYGHNRKRLVKEGDRVKSGQTIAEMGSSSANRDSLHFEIRKNGKPVNPADYLPRR